MKFSKDYLQQIIHEAIISVVREEMSGDVQSDEEAYALLNFAMEEMEGWFQSKDPNAEAARLKLDSIMVYFDTKLAGGENPEGMEWLRDPDPLAEATIEGCEEADVAFQNLINAQDDPISAEEAARNWLGVLQKCADEGKIAPTLLQLLLRGRHYRPGSETPLAPSTSIVGHDPRRPVTLPTQGRTKTMAEEKEDD
tara:strand:+ start:13629 stop:14216 length:588 start_codon:yes stop_codon:yes gene_type:complete